MSTPRCDTCGELVYYDYWGHVRECAKRRQRRYDREKAREAAERIIEKATGVDEQVRQGYQDYRAGRCRSIEEFMAELEADL